MPAPRQLVGLLWRWHRRLGVIAALFVLIIAITGIALNHTSELALDRNHIDWPWLGKFYGDSSSELPAYQLGDDWLVRASDGHIYLNSKNVAVCQGKLLGAVRLAQLLVAACREELLLITAGGELVEAVSASTGLTNKLDGIGVIDGELALKIGDSWWLADIEQMDFSRKASGGASISQLTAGKLPKAIRDNIPAAAQWLSWERVLLDLHSGRLFGRAGVVLVDGIGVLLACLATSGLAMWWLHRRKRQKHHRPTH